MRKWLMLALSLMILASGEPALAQTATATPASHPPSLRDRLKDLDEKIREEESSGKIGGKKAKELRNKVNQARWEMNEDVKSNGKKPLTDAQTRKIADELDRVSPQL